MISEDSDFLLMPIRGVLPIRGILSRGTFSSSFPLQTSSRCTIVCRVFPRGTECRSLRLLSKRQRLLRFLAGDRLQPRAQHATLQVLPRLLLLGAQLSDGPLAVPRFLARGEQASPPGRGNAGSAGDGPVRDVGPAESAGESAGAASGVHFRRVPRETWGWEGGGT